MAKIRLTKNELKRQKEILARLTRYLPTLELKKQQLINEIRTITRQIDQIKAEIEQAEKRIMKWVDVFAEDIDLKELISVEKIETEEGNVAGIDIPIFKEVIFKIEDYDLMEMPVWVDFAIEAVKEQIERLIRIKIFEDQIKILRVELRTTIQRINLFEKVMIPQTNENIRKIQIFLGDLQTAEVVRGKIAKAKLEKRREVS
ncbi:MAG: V-type ATP synthase subunit D [Candidatus Marinimicrobia bacterium]|nr:V-type ATP synthase subunit D [Candidatus Neomarinimicrobiota bacterium]